MMGKDYGRSAVLLFDFIQKIYPGPAGCILKIKPIFVSIPPDVDPACFKRYGIACRQLTAELFITIRFSTPQAVVEMSNDQPEIVTGKAGEEIKQGGGISPSGKCHNKSVTRQEETPLLYGLGQPVLQCGDICHFFVPKNIFKTELKRVKSSAAIKAEPKPATWKPGTRFAAI